jgi:hypothetical protein
MSYKLLINEVTRTTLDGVVETLQLKSGVNILEGPPNSGKTVWLKIIDFLLGETEKVEDVLSNEDVSGINLFEKYISASALITVEGSKYLLERKWHEQGMKHKIIINNHAIPAQEFSDYFLTLLKIPLLRFPKGNPYSENTWPSLSWRMMLRDIYRQENYWSDLADKQPEGETFAVLAQFLGIADKLFSQSFGEVIKKRKELMRLEAERNQFSQIMDDIGRSMAGPTENINFTTHESVNNAISNLENRIDELIVSRNALINNEVNNIGSKDNNIDSYILEKTAERQSLIIQWDNIIRSQKELIARTAEFRLLNDSINLEIEKFARAKEAGLFFADLKITHCPACDQKVSESAHSDLNSCFLCHQPLHKEQVESRMDFEISQLKSESEELKELIASLENENVMVEKSKERMQYSMNLIEREIAPLRNKISALISSEVSALDTERGRLQEQVENYKRILKNLDHKNELIKKIDHINKEIASLGMLLDHEESEINYGEVSGLLEDQMVNYLNDLTKTNPDRWTMKRPTFTISDRGFSFRVNEGKWSKNLGGTLKLYFLFAYHYGLLSLSKFPQCNYPGLLIIDFPPELQNTENSAISESYVVEPFVSLCASSTQPLQVIIAGRAFKDIDNVNKIEMSTAWK